MDLEQLKKQLEAFRAKLAEDIDAKIAEQSTATNEQVELLKEQLELCEGTLAEMKTAAEQKAQLVIPGLDEELKTNPFSWSAFIFAALAVPQVGHERAWANAGYEKEIIDAYEVKMRPIILAEKKDNIAGDGTQGGYLIPEEVTNELVGLTIANMPLMEMGVTKLEGLFGDLPIPRQTSRATGYWVGETEPPTESTTAFSDFTLRPKKAGAFSKFSRRLSYQTRGTADRIVKESITDSLALVIEEGFISGSGSDGQPKGYLNNTGFTTGASLATNGARFRTDKAAALIQALDVANELKQNGNFGFLMRPEVLGGMKRERIPQFTGQALGQGMPLSMSDVLMSQKQLEDITGYMIRTTTLLSGTETKGTTSTASKVTFANWKQLFLGFWRGMEIRVSDTASDASGNSAFLKDQFYVVAFQEVDSNVGRAAAFTIADDAEVNEANWSNG